MRLREILNEMVFYKKYNLEKDGYEPTNLLHQTFQNSFIAAKNSTRNSGADFTITVADAWDAFKAHLPKLEAAYNSDNKNVPRLLTIDDDLGYVPGNIIYVPQKEAAVIFDIRQTLYKKYKLEKEGYDPNNPFHALFAKTVARAKSRAKAFRGVGGKQNGILFTVGVPEMWKAFYNKQSELEQAYNANNKNVPRLIRIDPSKGFIPGNIDYVTAAEAKKKNSANIGSSRKIQVKYNLYDQGFEDNNKLHINFIEAIQRAIHLSHRYRKDFLININDAWEVFKNQDGESAISTVKFSEEHPAFKPTLKLIDPEKGFVDENFYFITVWETYNRPHGLEYEDEDPNIIARFKALYRKSRQRASNKGHVFNIDFIDAWKIFKNQNKKCALTGIEFSQLQTLNPLEVNTDQEKPDPLGFTPDSEQADPYAFSPDQEQPGMGYTKENLQFILWKVNQSKNNLNNEQYISLCQRILDYHNGTAEVIDVIEDPFVIPATTTKKTPGKLSKKLSRFDARIPLHSMWEIRTRAANSPAVRGTKKVLSLERDIPPEYGWDVINKQGWRCALTGIPLESSGPNMLSKDRIDSAKGYVEGNLQFVTVNANKVKTDMNLNQLLALCQQVVDYNKNKQSK